MILTVLAVGIAFVYLLALVVGLVRRNLKVTLVYANRLVYSLVGVIWVMSFMVAGLVVFPSFVGVVTENVSNSRGVGGFLVFWYIMSIITIPVLVLIKGFDWFKLRKK